MILVFGKTGQLARELAAYPDVKCVGRDEADLMNPAACADLILSLRPEAVINAAAYTGVDAAEDDEATAQIVNGDAPGAMAQACASLDIAFVHISTDYVFDGSGETPWQPDDPTGPLGAYGRTKLVGEHAVAQADGRFAIVRTSWVFSRHGKNFVKTMLRLGAERDRLNIVSDQIGGPTEAGDLAQAALQAAKALNTDPSLRGIYHYAGAPYVSWADFARAIFEIAELDVTVSGIPTRDYPTPAQRPLNSRLDCSTLDKIKVEQSDWRPALEMVVQALKA